MWFVEDFRLFTYWRAFAPLYDFFAVIQRSPFLEELAAQGQENALYLPLAAEPSFHRPLELAAVEKRKFGSQVSFLGAGYPNRRLAFRRLLGRDFKLWGSDWDGDAALAAVLQRGGERIAPEDAVKIFNASEVNLNLHSSVSIDPLVSGGDFVNPRTFELAACGAFQLVDQRALLPELFAPDELATFTTVQEMEALLDHYLARPEERRAMAERARARVLRDHAYARRMQALLDFIKERRPGWPTNRAAASALEGMDPTLAQELAALLERLRLPVNAAFPDVVEAVRRQRGILSDLDTALLFLDEWRKQYGVDQTS